MEKRKPKVLFLCTGNSCRSQMAEGWARSLWDERIEAHSAGIIAYGLNEDAVAVMAEAGVDISRQRSKAVGEFQGQQFDLVVTLCGNAQARCPAFPGGTRVLHVGFDDPPTLAARAWSEEERMTPFRRVRDEIRAFVENLPEILDKEIP
ncbi:MAG: arsenate reductase ArsC [Pirellulales bacterium]|nr:arsenate reductase ArsC [Pirellulales bacterium]